MKAYAVMCVDPGTTTGCARAFLFPTERDKSAWDTLTYSKHESWECEGSPAEQAWWIMDEFAEWSAANEPVASFIVCESFSLRYFNRSATLLDPVRVAAGMEALALRRDGSRWATINYQNPSDAKGFATDARLREAGLWVAGSAHRRDAVRHLALAVARADRLKKA